MPTGTITHQGNPTQYFRLKNKMKYELERNGKMVERESPAFVKWNKDTKQNEFVDISFGGHLTKVELKELETITAPDGKKKFTTRPLVLEFSSLYKDGSRQIEKLTIESQSKYGRDIIAKLLGATDFSDINFLCGRITSAGKPGETASDKDFVAVYEGASRSRLEKMIVFARDKSENPIPDGAVVLPSVRYYARTEKNKFEITTDYTKAIEDANGFKMKDPEWVREVDEIYVHAVALIAEKVEEFNQTHPVQYITSMEAPAKDEKSKEQEYVVPDLTITDEDIDDYNIITQAPF